MKLIHCFLIIFFSLLLNLYARPDLIIENSGDNLYGILNKGMGGSFTLEDGENGKFNVVSFKIQNDNSTFDNSSSQIYHISVIMPSDNWKYFFSYKGNKYTGEWATDIISNGEYDTFSLYIMPPFGTSAKTYHIIINATYGEQVDSCDLYFNVTETAKFDLSYIKNDNITIGEGIFETSIVDVQTTYIGVNFCDSSHGRLRIQNIGNKKGFFYLKFYSSDFTPTQFEFLFDNISVTYLLENYIKGVLLPGDTSYLDFYFNGYNLQKSGNFYIYLYDANFNIVDKYKISITVINSSKFVNYKFPKISTEEPVKYSALILVNEDNNSHQIILNKDEKFYKQISILKKSMEIIPIEENGEYSLNSVFPVVPLIIQLDENLCELNKFFPDFFKRTAKKIIIPLIINLKNSPVNITIYNPNKSSAEGKLLIYTNEGLLISSNDISLKGNETKFLKKSDLKLNDDYKFYWGYLNFNAPVNVYFFNKLLNCYLSYQVPGL